MSSRCSSWSVFGRLTSNFIIIIVFFFTSPILRSHLFSYKECSDQKTYLAPRAAMLVLLVKTSVYNRVKRDFSKDNFGFFSFTFYQVQQIIKKNIKRLLYILTVEFPIISSLVSRFVIYNIRLML